MTTCEVKEGLHLKSVMSMFAPDVILISLTNSAVSIRSQIEKKSAFNSQYRFIEVPEDNAANMLTFNGKILTSLDYEDVYSGFEDFQKHSNNLKVRNSEFKKIDGCLTCRCVFFKSKNLI